MKCLYTTKTEYNYDEFKRYNWTMLVARGKLAQHLLLEAVLIVIKKMLTEDEIVDIVGLEKL